MRRLGATAAVIALAAAGQAHTGGGAGAAKAKTHVVARGDRLGVLAARYGVSLASLARATDIARADRIRIGQVLVVPTRDARAPAPTTTAAPAPAPVKPLASPVVVLLGGADARHQVEPGESLTTIARRYDTTVALLSEANSLADPDRIRSGSDLVVPGTTWLCPVSGADRKFADDWGAPRSGGRRHLGNDVFAPRGTPVVASVAGTVEDASGGLGGLAYYLRGEDGHTYYGAHLDTLAPPGPVERGGVIGTVGSSGNAGATAPHLHFEIRPDNGSPVNPYFTLARWC
ncbi:MAG: M23 family metallopeptidase [Acidimicrobiales bacterium]